MERTVADLIDSAKDEDVFVVGPGTSMKGFDWSRLNHVKTIALNGAIAAEGFEPTYHFWCDGLVAAKWPVIARETTCVCPKPCAMLPPLVSIYKEVVTWKPVLPIEPPMAKWMKGEFNLRWPLPWAHLTFPSHEEMQVDDDGLYCYNTCATGAIHFAAKLGARRILLVGLDAYGMKTGESYFDGKHSAVDDDRPIDMGEGRIRCAAHITWDMEQAKACEYWQARGRYLEPWPGSGIFNLSKFSTLTSYQKVDLETALADSLALVEI